ncbi:hypothetical protein IAI10_02060 [Clostridium sp. 19966]|uniref:hypothetical protein n=1 Tax=Clostridium sp. 19966 TaxID=2768166 RepID=UPI0028DEADEF|nr:hypothetical protein [Clostridium sp. 19966]MDT8715441.1 hypothetical protein [Clostridium sp. 19966]
MRLRERDKKDLYLKRAVIKEDAEKVKYTDYETTSQKIRATIQPAGGKIEAEIYGEKLKYMLTMRYDGNVELKENDGICVYVSPDSMPDYRIVAIKLWAVKVIDLEAI